MKALRPDDNLDRSPVPESPSTERTGLTGNTGALVAGRVIGAVLGWAGSIVIARDLGTEGFGHYTVVFGILGMMTIVTDLGVGRFVIGGLIEPRADRNRLAGTYILLRTLLGIGGYLVAVGSVVLLGYPPSVIGATAVAGFVVLLATPSHAYDVAFQVTHRLRPVAAATLGGQMVQLALILAVAMRGGTLLWFIVPAVLKEVVILAWKAPAAHRLLAFRYQVDLGMWRGLLREAAPLTLGTAFITLYYRVDVIMLSRLGDFSDAGRYGVAYKFVDLAHFVPTALTVAILAPLTASWRSSRGSGSESGGPDSFSSILAQGADLLMLAAGAALVGVWLFADKVIAMTYGSAYEGVGTATAIVVTAECLGFFTALGITALVAAGQHRRYPAITFLGLVANLAMNAVLIPRFSYTGAAVATLATELLVLVLLVIHLGHAIGPVPMDTTSLGHVALATGAAMTAGALLTTLVHWTVALGAAGCTYVLVLTLVRRDRGGLRTLLGMATR